MHRMNSYRWIFIALTLVVMMVPSISPAQNYYDHWAFGNNVHMDFTNGAPTVTCNASITSFEAAAVWSDPVTGDFIAYTSGNIVYNGQNHATLANGTGLTAQASSIESALILPVPGATIDDIYIFHNNITNTYWSRADMTVGTNGTVTSKNNFLLNSGSERCGTAPHGNLCPAYWLMINKGMNDSVAAYLIDANGISANPVVTSTGITGGNARGNIVFSEDFTKMAMSVESKGMYVADFDNLTGMTSNWQKIGTTTSGFGSAFSPDGTKLYYTSTFGGTLYQYNFSNSTQTALGGTGLSYLALAPDGKIYISKWGQQSLGVINVPNNAGTGCNFQQNGFTIVGPPTCRCNWGLPNPFHVDIGVNKSRDTITLCPGEDTLYTTDITGDTFLWNTGDTTASILLDSAGLYYCTIINGECTSSDSIYLQYVDAVEISGFDACEGDSIQFTLTTAMPADQIVSYDWSFGDGNSSTDTMPKHAYNYGDTFLVTLDLETQTGCVLDTFTTIIAYNAPDVDFEFENVCDGEQVQFQQLTVEGDTSIVSYNWDINNNGTVDYLTTNAAHNYPGFASYAVELMVDDLNGCADSVVKQVFVHPMPTADFEIDNECLGIEQQFRDSSTLAQGNIALWTWDFGDGDSASIQHPLHTYTSSGTKTISLIIETDSGCVDMVSKSALVYHLPVANFQADSVCENVNAVFNNTSTSQSGAVVQNKWNFGDGDTSSIQSPTHDYAAPGLREVSLAVTTQFGCVDTVTRPIRIYPAPQTAFGWKNNVCQGDDLPFYDQTLLANVTPGGDQIVSWNWTLNGENFSTNQHPVYATKTFQDFAVSLTTTTNYGCTTTANNVARIFPLPEAGLTTENACEDIETGFTSTSTVVEGVIAEWLWDFGDGNNTVLENPTHVYESPGRYDVKLVVSTTYGCKDSIEGKVTIHEAPVPKFSSNPVLGCADLRVSFENESSIGNGDLKYRWYAGGNQFSSLKNPTRVFGNDTLEPVSYTIRLVAISELGCSKSIRKVDYITVLPKPKAKFSFSEDEFSMFEPEVNFNNISEHSVRWQWDLGDGDTVSDFAPRHVYEKSGEYFVNLIAWNEYNCPDTAEQFVVLDPITTLYIPSAFTPNGDDDNDVWGVKGFNEGNRFEIRVWDRWGHLVFESDDMNFTWDGKLSDGRLAPIGMYAYHIVYRSSDYKIREATGQFSLVR
ncbi:MAG: hypothetical protein Salg2KO_07650 [Salibacteraceae bacterium]